MSRRKEDGEFIAERCKGISLGLLAQNGPWNTLVSYLGRGRQLQVLKEGNNTYAEAEPTRYFAPRTSDENRYGSRQMYLGPDRIALAEGYCLSLAVGKFLLRSPRRDKFSRTGGGVLGA